MKKARSGEKSTRSAIASVRFDPKLRYLAELAARKHRRSVSSFVEWAVENSLKTVVLYDGSSSQNDVPVTIEDEAHRLWDVSEPERLLRLAILYPELLTIEEQEIWKLIQDAGFLAPAKMHGSDGGATWLWPFLEDRVFPEVRRRWPEIESLLADGALEDRNAFIAQVRASLSSGELYPEK